MAAKLIRIHGQVQGVSYRAWTVNTATRLGLTGWVRNRKGGSVEALAVGPEDVIDELIGLCREGPPSARVDKIETEEADPEDLSAFEQRETV